MNARVLISRRSKRMLDTLTHLQHVMNSPSGPLHQPLREAIERRRASMQRFPCAVERAVGALLLGLLHVGNELILELVTKHIHCLDLNPQRFTSAGRSGQILWVVS